MAGFDGSTPALTQSVKELGTATPQNVAALNQWRSDMSPGAQHDRNDPDKGLFGGGILGALVFQVVYSFSSYGDAHLPMQLLGASGGVSAVVIGTAVFTPRYKLFLFGLVEVELRWIAVAKILLDLAGLSSGNNLGGYTAHLGGILWGAGYVWFALKSGAPEWLSPIFAIFTKKSPRKSTLRFEKGDKPLHSKKTQPGGPSEAEVNALLDKISQVGYNNLTAKEKETLFKASKTD